MLSSFGAAYGSVDGVEVPLRFAGLEREVRAIRASVALSVEPHVVCLRVAGDGAYDLLDRVCSGDLFVRDGTLRHTLLLNDDGTPFADAYLCNDDDVYLLLAEGVSTPALIEHLDSNTASRQAVTISDLGRTHAVLSLNGPFAWELLATLEGPEVAGFPYLTFYHPDDERIYVRAGKTGEFGYDLLVPHEQAPGLLRDLLDAGQKLDVTLAGMEALWHCQLENWFFNVYREGRQGLTPLELGLQWRVSWSKKFVGAEALRSHRSAGPKQRVTAVQADAPIAANDTVLFQDESIGRILHAAPAISLEADEASTAVAGRHFGVALLGSKYAHSGIHRYGARNANGTVPLSTVSPPFVNNLSLYVNAQKHDYETRREIAFPGAFRHP